MDNLPLILTPLLLLLLLVLSVPVAFALMAAAALMIAGFSSVDTVRVMGAISYGALDSVTLVALPLFILMGELIVRAGFARSLLDGLRPLLERLPGGLLHVNVIGSAMFAAVSGSSAATAATIGKITLPELARRGYPQGLSIGSLAGAGTLGFLIPPSLIMIVYGFLAEVSVGSLFMAGIVPGLVLALLFSGWVAITGRQLGKTADLPQTPVSGGTVLLGILSLLPFSALIALVLGSIYLGVATPTESAAVGVFLVLATGLSRGRLDRGSLTAAVQNSVVTTSMIGLIVAGAACMATAMGYLGLPPLVAGLMADAELGPLALMLLLTVFYIVLGMFLDGISMVVITLPVVLPLVRQAGLDLLWFGVWLVLMAEAGQLTPPLGFNLFVLKNLTGSSLSVVARAALPFFCIIIVMSVVLVFFPGLAVWLPASP